MNTVANDSADPGQAVAAVISNLLNNRLAKFEARRRKSSQPTNSFPVPETPPLPPPLSDRWKHAFRIPTRRILTTRDHQLFLASPTYALILSFILQLSESVANRPISSATDSDLTPPVRGILTILEEAHQLLLDTPPDDQGGSRFGNKGFRTFLDKLKRRCPAWHNQLLDIPHSGATAELVTYLAHSFGNRQRIDYGSGHELHFCVWLLCLYRLSIVSLADFPALVLQVFSRYLSLMRAIQTAYYLEPAGSHGVWGLDDYQFLPFLFGASQLLNHPYVTPKSVHHELTLEELGDEYLYLGQVAFVNSTKTVRGLRWHSPMLDDISGAKGGWPKVEGGMRRMFVAEVLGKLPVMQHFLFGGLVEAADGMSDGRGVAHEEDEDEGGEVHIFDRDGVRHVHQQNVGWGDCCGIKVPSSVGAAEELRKRAGRELRRIPFD